MRLRFLNEKRLAIIFRRDGDQHYCVRGTGIDYRRGPRQRELVVQLDRRPQRGFGPRDMAVVIQESDWEGTVSVDTEHGCDYRLDIPLDR